MYELNPMEERLCLYFWRAEIIGGWMERRKCQGWNGFFQCLILFATSGLCSYFEGNVKFKTPSSLVSNIDSAKAGSFVAIIFHIQSYAERIDLFHQQLCRRRENEMFRDGLPKEKYKLILKELSARRRQTTSKEIWMRRLLLKHKRIGFTWKEEVRVTHLV